MLAAINNGLPVYASVTALVVDPQTPSTIYVATSPPGLYKSIDGGNNWSATFNGRPKAAAHLS